MEGSVAILVAHHKPDLVVQAPYLVPIQVGRAVAKEILPMQGDDTGVNISHKNGAYCELTAIHWAAHNLEADYVGLCHYRRYFTFRRRRAYALRARLYALRSRLMRAVDLGRMDHIWDQTVCTDPLELQILCEEFSRGLRDLEFDALFLEPLELGNSTVRQFFSEKTGNGMLESLRSAVRTLRPDLAAACESVVEGTSLSPCNMFILRRELFEEYHRFLFTVLEEVERTWFSGIDFTNLIPPHRRMIGYLGELLTATFARSLRARSDVHLLHANIVQYMPELAAR